jgi:hypothetical protein
MCDLGPALCVCVCVIRAAVVTSLSLIPPWRVYTAVCHATATVVHAASWLTSSKYSLQHTLTAAGMLHALVTREVRVRKLAVCVVCWAGCVWTTSLDIHGCVCVRVSRMMTMIHFPLARLRRL